MPPAASIPRWLYFVLAGLVVCVAGALVAWRAVSMDHQLVGATVFEDRTPAPDFTLTDQLGQPTTLSQFLGRPIALTFVYTHCPDVCPIIASNMHTAYLQLGSQAAQVALLAVTVDPENDTVDQLRAFSDQRGLTDEWHFVTGTRPQLEAVWQSFGILAQPVDPSGRPVSPAAQRALEGLPATPDQVEHSAPVYLIDRQGAERATLPDDFTPDQLSHDLRVLLGER
jgi:protein SCO1/2